MFCMIPSTHFTFVFKWTYLRHKGLPNIFMAKHCDCLIPWSWIPNSSLPWCWNRKAPTSDGSFGGWVWIDLAAPQDSVPLRFWRHGHGNHNHEIPMEISSLKPTYPLKNECSETTFLLGRPYFQRLYMLVLGSVNMTLIWGEFLVNWCLIMHPLGTFCKNEIVFQP